MVFSFIASCHVTKQNVMPIGMIINYWAVFCVLLKSSYNLTSRNRESHLVYSLVKRMSIPFLVCDSNVLHTFHLYYLTAGSLRAVLCSSGSVLFGSRQLLIPLTILRQSLKLLSTKLSILKRWAESSLPWEYWPCCVKSDEAVHPQLGAGAFPQILWQIVSPCL